MKTIVTVVGGKKGYASWRLSFIGDQSDEYNNPSPEHVLSPWHDLGLDVGPDNNYNEDFSEKNFYHMQMIVTIPKK